MTVYQTDQLERGPSLGRTIAKGHKVTCGGLDMSRSKEGKAPALPFSFHRLFPHFPLGPRAPVGRIPSDNQIFEAEAVYGKGDIDACENDRGDQ